MSETKTCRACWQAKPLAAFERGTVRQCKACRASRRNKNRLAQKARDPLAFKRQQQIFNHTYYVKNRQRLKR